MRARKGYYAPLDGTRAQDKKKQGGPDPQIQAALDSPYEQDEVPLRMTSYVMGETLLGKASVLVAADVNVTAFGFEEKEGRLHDTLEYLMVVAHRESGEYFRYDQKVEMKLRPETQRPPLEVLVRDRQGLRAGARAATRPRSSCATRTRARWARVVHEFEVPDLTQFRVSTPILSDVVQPSEDEQDRAAADAPGPPHLLGRGDAVRLVRGARRGQGQEDGHAGGQRRLRDPAARRGSGDAVGAHPDHADLAREALAPDRRAARRRPRANTSW